jgi:hypothetical protein
MVVKREMFQDGELDAIVIVAQTATSGEGAASGKLRAQFERLSIPRQDIS